MRRTNHRRPRWRYPRNQGNITTAFLLYFEMLETAMARGWPLDVTATPRERTEALEHVLAGAPVREITACFNDACYGEMSRDSVSLATLQAALRQRRGPHRESAS